MRMYQTYVENAPSKRVPRISSYIHLMQESSRFFLLQASFLCILLGIYTLALVGFGTSLKNGKIREVWVFSLLLFYFAMVVPITLDGNSRYRFPSIAFYCLIGGYGLSALVKARRRSRLGLGLAEGSPS